MRQSPMEAFFLKGRFFLENHQKLHYLQNKYMTPPATYANTIHNTK